MRRTLKIIGWTLGTLVAGAVLIIAAVAYLTTSDIVRAQIEDRAYGYSGRKTQIRVASVDWGPITHVHLHDMQLANADWASGGPLFKAEQIDFDIALRPLLYGRVVVPLLHMVKPEINLERNDKGEANWAMKHRPALPEIGRLEVDQGHVTFKNLARHLALDGTLQTSVNDAGGAPQADLSLKGTLDDKPITLHAAGGPLLALNDSKTPYPVDLMVTSGDTHIAAKGTVQNPMELQSADMQLAMSGQSLADVYPLLGIPAPPTPPYKLNGKLGYQDQVWTVSDMAWHVGDSDLAGKIAIDRHTKPARLTGDLTSDHLRFADLAPLIGAGTAVKGVDPAVQQKKTERKLEASGNLFPNTPLHTERLRVMNMAVHLIARKVVAPPYLPLNAIDAQVQVEGGQAVVQPLKMTFGNGTASGQITLDAHGDTPRVGIDLDLSNIDLATFFRGSQFLSATKGQMQGHVRLAGTGRSLAEAMGNANGDIAMVMDEGSVSSLLVSMAGLQVADSLILSVTGDHRIPIRCATARMNVSNGTAAFDHILMDTQKSVLHFEGQANLKSQTIHSEITADPKRFALLDLHAPVMIEGKIRKPEVTIGRSIPVPTPDFGTAKDVACQQLAQQVLSDQQ